MTAVQKLRAMLADPEKITACPGVYDGFTARIALAEGAECLYMTGAGTTMSRLGLPDLGLATLTEMATNATLLASLSPSTPLIADADTGYGNALQVSRTVTAYMRAGVAGLHLEDQEVGKRCGHLEGKRVVRREEWVGRVRAAVMVRGRERERVDGGDVVIIARSDALQGLGYEEAVWRLRAAVEVGADVAFLEGVTSREMAERFVRDLAPTPCLFNNVPGGVSPDLTVQEAREIGFKIAIYPVLGLEVVYSAVRRGVRQLLDEGVVRGVEADGRRWGIRELFGVCGLEECVEFEREAGEGRFGVGCKI
ncbi:carboxyvinyl-carboxyphosphonate phosphorylmutase [Lentithecium fluviatile CBS 122367]|uniref:Carboxyvinyl-carboxyphosphonate phosphorylmutase n=1 Tax=Lentithecium fluviatile CBS 122367 TaxID=1168545 RepID=A0A6G1J9V3_9PLEO|nr:carboxyvinyl-carboxyphosphonate phosphorylmutase [Lentithecium fluviatile CBS 122367]